MNYNKNLFSFSDGIYRTKELMIYKIEFENKIIKVKVPYNFGWNGVTGFRTTLKTLVPSMVHDWLIYNQRINGDNTFSRKDMDKIFIIMCTKNKVSCLEILVLKTGLNINRNILMKFEKKQ